MGLCELVGEMNEVLVGTCHKLVLVFLLLLMLLLLELTNVVQMQQQRGILRQFRSTRSCSVVQRLTWIFGDIILSKNKKRKCTESPRVKRKQRVQHAMT
jgi:hypothetical protein